MEHEHQSAVVFREHLEAAAERGNSEHNERGPLYAPQSVHRRSVHPAGEATGLQPEHVAHVLWVLSRFRSALSHPAFLLTTNQLSVRAGRESGLDLCARDRSNRTDAQRA